MGRNGIDDIVFETTFEIKQLETDKKFETVFTALGRGRLLLSGIIPANTEFDSIRQVSRLVENAKSEVVVIIGAIIHNRMKFAEDICAAIGIGLASARANRVPMVVLWAAVVLMALGYYHVPWVATVLNPLHEWQDAQGWVAAFLNRFVFCGIIPGVFVMTMKMLAVRHPFAAILAQTLWSGICGIVSGWMYELNALWFGTGVDFWTLSVKTVVCQFVWTPFFFAPVGALVYYWIGRDFSLARCRGEWSSGFWTETFLPNLLVNWVVWIPSSMLVHMFPTALQIQLTGFVNAYFCLVLLWIGRGSRSDRH